MTIFTPDSFAGDPLAWIGNQTAHALLIGGGGWALLVWAGLRRAHAYAVVAGLYALWEAITYRGDTLDGVTDWAFVIAGAAMAWAAWVSDRKDLRLVFAGVIIAGIIGMGLRL